MPMRELPDIDSPDYWQLLAKVALQCFVVEIFTGPDHRCVRWSRHMS